MKPILLVSRCLLGEPCRYDGAAKKSLAAELRAIGLADEAWIAVCPEMDGGLPCPRKSCEIEPGFEGGDVLDGRARVLAADGSDCTAQYLAGARQAAQRADALGIKFALLKAKSPSCGCSAVYDGTHSGRLKAGRGVAAALLARKGLALFDESSLKALQARLCGEKRRVNALKAVR